MKRVTITNMVTQPILILIPEMNFRRELMSKGAKIHVGADVFEEMSYHIGFSNMVQQGLVRCDNIPEEVEEVIDLPKVKTYTDKDFAKIALTSNEAEVREILDEMPPAQMREFAFFLAKQPMLNLIYVDEIKERLNGLNIQKLRELNK